MIRMGGGCDAITLNLDRGRMRAEQERRLRGTPLGVRSVQIESILGIASGMILRRIQGLKTVIIVFGLGSVRNGKTDSAK